MMNKILLLAAILFFCSADFVFSQSPPASAVLPKFPSPDYIVAKSDNSSDPQLNFSKWIRETINILSVARPGALPSNTKSLEAAIKEASDYLIPELRSLGFSENQSLRAIFASLVEVSVKKYDEDKSTTTFTKDELITLVERTGELEIKTQPDHAIIEIDKYTESDPSDTSIWLTEGKHHLRIRKKGYTDISEFITIEAQSPQIIKRTLKPVK